jgi:hypothetical protein
MSYKSVYIVIEEAKKQDLNAGLNQNMMQQWNFLESLADKCLPTTLSGRKRKVDFDTKFNNLKKLGTFGITSTGEKWIFSRVEEAPEGCIRPVIVYQSNIYHMTLFYQEINIEKRIVIDQQVETLLRRIVHMIKTQKRILSSKFSYLLSDDIQSRLFFANAEEMMNRDAESNDNQDEVDDDPNNMTDQQLR